MKALVIPACRPSGALVKLIDSLPPGEFAVIVVVDDGGQGSIDLPGVTVVRHAVRVGRGAAIRTGMHAALAAAPDLDSIVVAEEFHSAGDIARVSARKDALILGARSKARRNWPTRVLAGIRCVRPMGDAPLHSGKADSAASNARIERRRVRRGNAGSRLGAFNSDWRGENRLGKRATRRSPSALVVSRNGASLSRHDAPACRFGVLCIRRCDRSKRQRLCHWASLRSVHLVAVGPSPVSSLWRAVRWLEFARFS